MPFAPGMVRCEGAARNEACACAVRREPKLFPIPAAEAAHERSVCALAKRMMSQAKRAKKEQRRQALLLEVSVTYSMMLETTPDPTVRPPSRIAKRSPCSMAIGVISLIVMRMLSPGMTISTPSGSSIVPVTSVVRK